MQPLDVYSLPKTPLPLPESIVLYQYEVCPFCCKVKAFLDYHKVRDMGSKGEQCSVAGKGLVLIGIRSMLGSLGFSQTRRHPPESHILVCKLAIPTVTSC